MKPPTGDVLEDFTFISYESCFDPVVINAILEAASRPKSFVNRKGPSPESERFMEGA